MNLSVKPRVVRRTETVSTVEVDTASTKGEEEIIAEEEEASATVVATIEDEPEGLEEAADAATSEVVAEPEPTDEPEKPKLRTPKQPKKSPLPVAAEDKDLAVASDEATAEAAAKAKSEKTKLVSTGRKKEPVAVELPGGKLSRKGLCESFQNFVSENIGGLESITAEESKTLLDSMEKWLEENIHNHPLQFAGFFFSHKQKGPCFREPGRLINYISGHTEIKAKRTVGVVKKVCTFEGGVFKAGDQGKDSNGLAIVVPNKKDTADILPIYNEHLKHSIERLEADERKATARKEKILSRGSKLL